MQARARCIYREEHDDTHLEVWEQGDCRSLWFDDLIMQTEIHIHDPAVLPNPVNRAMLAHLMFDRPLERVLLAGCGGGAIARWLNARSPEVRGDAVELSATVARLAFEYFDFPPPGGNWRLLVGDVREHLTLSEVRYDYILVDLEENQNTPDWVTDTAFLKRCHDRLAPQGNLTLNLILGDGETPGAALLRLRQVFGGETMLLTEPEHGNLLVLAFKGTAPQLPPQDRLAALGRRWGIDFAKLAARLTRVAPPEAAGDPG